MLSVFNSNFQFVKLRDKLETGNIGNGNIIILATFTTTAFSSSTARNFILSVRHSKIWAESALEGVGPGPVKVCVSFENRLY